MLALSLPMRGTAVRFTDVGGSLLACLRGLTKIFSLPKATIPVDIYPQAIEFDTAISQAEIIIT